VTFLAFDDPASAEKKGKFIRKRASVVEPLMSCLARFKNFLEILFSFKIRIKNFIATSSIPSKIRTDRCRGASLPSRGVWKLRVNAFQEFMRFIRIFFSFYFFFKAAIS